jgi:hypothetical protein
VSNEIRIVVSSQDKTAGFDSVKKGAKDAETALEKTGEQAKKTGKELDGAGKQSDGLGTSLKRTGEIAAGILAADLLTEGAAKVKDFFTSTIDAASNLGESMNAVGRVFDTEGDKVLDWGKKNGESFGLSQRAFNEAVTPMGALLKNAGLSMDQVADQTLNLTQRAADMASVFNTSVPDALEAIQAGLRGESDPLERFGVSLSAAKVEAEALAETGKKSASALTSQELATARLNVIMAQTASTAGDFRNTSDGLANSQRIAAAQIEDAKAKLGAGLLPVLAQAAKLGGEFATVFGKLPSNLQTVTLAAAALAAGFIFLAPKIKAAKDLFDDLGKGSLAADTKMGKFARTAGYAGAALAGLEIANAVGRAFEDAAADTDKYAKSLEEFAQSGKETGEALRLAGKDLKQFDKDVKFTNNSGGLEGLKKGASMEPGFMSAFNGSLQETLKRMQALDQAMATMVQSGHAQDAQQVFAALAVEAEKQGISMEKLKAMLPQYADALNAATKAGGASAAAASDAAIQYGALSQQLNQTSETADTLAGKMSDKLFNGLLAADHAALNLAESQTRLTETLDKNKNAFDINTAAGQANREAILAKIEANIREYDSMIASGYSAKQAADAYDSNTAALERQLHKMKFTDDQIRQLIGSYKSVPDRVNTEILTKGLTDALNNLGSLLARLNGLDGSVFGYTIKSVTVYSSDWQDYRSGERHASGGIASGGPTWLGEMGPELVDLPNGSRVYPASNSQAMLAQSQGPRPASSEVTFAGDVDSAVATMFQRLIRERKITILSSAVVTGS